MRMIDRIRSQLGRDLPLATLLRAGTVELLARAVRSHTGPTPWSPLVELQEGSRVRAPLFCIHAMGGEVLCYAELARYLGPDQPFYGLQARSWAEPDAEPPRSIEEMAASYLAAIRQVQPAGPYHLAGWSLGGIIALEMAQQLHAEGDSVALLAIFDTNLLARGGSADAAEFIFRFARRHPSLSVEHMRTLGSVDEQLAYAFETAAREGFLPPGLDLAMAVHYARAGEASSRAKETYVPKPYPGRVTLFRATSGHVDSSPDPSLGWEPLALGGLEIFDVPGSHNVLMEKPYVQTLAKRLRACLDREAPVLAVSDRLL